MKNYSTHYLGVCLLILGLCRLSDAFANSAVQEKKLGRHEFSLVADADAVYLFTDRYDVFFDVPASDMKLAFSGARFGIEGVGDDHWGLRLLAGYQRVFYSDIGFQEIEKNYITTDLLFEYFFFRNVIKNDPYVFVGPTALWSESGKQAFVMTGMGFKHFINHSWSLRFEPAIATDFKGLRFQLNIGFSCGL